MADEFNADAAVDAYLGGTPPDTASGMRASLATAVGVNADAQAEAVRVARRTGVPVDTVLAQPDEMKRKATLSDIDFASYARMYPASASVLSDPAFAKFAHDDMDNMGQTEGVFGTLRAASGPKPSFSSTAYGLYSSLSTGAELTRQGIRQQMADAFGWDKLSSDAQLMAERARFRQFLVDPAFDSSTAQGLYSGGRSLVQMAPGLVGSLVTRNPSTVLAAAGLQTETEAYTRYRARGATPEEAALGAVGEGAIEVVTEKLPMGFLVDKLGKVGAGEFIKGFLGRELVGEQLATLTQDMLDTAIANPDKTWGDYLSERPEAAYQTALATFVSSAVFASANELTYRVSGEHAKAQRAEENAKALEQMNQLAAASKVRQRDPESFRQFIDAANQNGAVQDIYIDVRELAQAGIDPQALAQISPSAALQLETAVQAGSDIRIPVGEFATSIAGTELGQSLIDHLKTDPEGMSRAQAAEFMQTQGEQLQAEVEKVLTEKQGDDTFKASRDAVQTNVLEQLTTANRFTADVNTPYAALMANFYAVQAARLGTTPEELFKQYPVAIQASSVAGPSLDQGEQALPTPDTLNTPAAPDKTVMDTSSRVESVPLDKVLATQTRREWGKFEKGEHPGALVDGYGDKPIAARWSNGSYLLFDGHHRAELALRRGDKTLDMHVVDVKSYAPEADKQPLKPARNNISDEELLRELGFDQPAFHGSPYQFDKFTLDHMGKGEGAQAYGWGLYFAGNKEVAEFYRQSTTQPDIDTGNFQSDLGQSLSIVARGNPGKVLAELQAMRERQDVQQDQIDALEHDIEMLREEAPLGQLYRAEIPDDDVLLQWEKPLSEQPPAVLKALESFRDIPEVYQNVIDLLEQPDLFSGVHAYQALVFAEKSAQRASRSLNAVGIKGIKYRDANSRIKGASENITHNFVIFDDNAIEVLGTFYQGEGQRRGSFNPGTSTITLLKAADLSTFLHESGHFFLETLNKLAQQENAPPELAADMDTVLQWFQVDGKTPAERVAAWNSMDIEAQRENHEKFARGFESYLFEGKAPSIDMQGVFQRFRAWLLNVYKELKNLNVKLSDDVRGVFDRMLATSEQIKEVEDLRYFRQMFASAEEAGMTAEEWKAYQELGNEATQQAISTLEARSLRDMKWLTGARNRILKEMQRDAEVKRRAIRKEATDEVMREPVNMARTFLKRGTVNGEQVDGAHRLDIDALEEMYDSNPVDPDAPTPPWKALQSKYGKYGVIGKDGLHPDAVAEMFGFSSGDELIKALVEAEDPREKIAGLTDQRMLERYGDLTDPAAMARAADAAVHNEARTRFVATELNALQKVVGGRKILTKAAKEYAEAMINRLLIRNVKPTQYAAAEVRAAKAAEKARAAGDMQTAATEKRNQLIQNYATRAAYDALDTVESGLRYLQKFANEGTRKKVDTDYLEQIDALLERFDLRKATSLKAVEKRKSLVEWVQAQEAMGLEPELPPGMLDEANRKSYKDMTVEEMKGLLDTVRQIEHLGRLKNKLLTAKDNRDFAAVVDKMVGSITLNAGLKRADNRTRANAADRAARLFKGYLASHRKISSLARELDGFKDGGAVWETFIRAMNEAGNREAVMREQATKKLAGIVKPLLTVGKMGGKGTYFASIGRSLNREERIGIALNTGNLGNYQRLLDGEGWTPKQVAPVLDSLSKEDWDAVQAIWDFFEAYRPMIAAKEKRIYGKEPAWVDPHPVTTKFGEYRGGYYPIKYDARRSAAAEQYNDAETAKQQLRGAFTSSTTRRSFTKTRADEVKGRPLLYAMDGLFQGVNEVIHDLSWHEWLIDANRLLRNKKLDGAIRERYGAEVIAQFKTAITDIAAGEMPANDALEKVLGNLRAGSMIAGLGLNVMTAAINTTGITQSMVRIGPKWVAMGIGEWARSPRALVKQIHNKSDFMRLRAQTQLREINEIRSRVQGKTEMRQAIDKIMFMPLAFTQLAVDTPTWWGAYQKALVDGQEESRAVALADQAVLDAQSGGQVKDLAAIQRGGPIKKLLTTFYGYFSATYNLSAEAVNRTDFKDPLSVLRLGGDYLMLYTLPALLGTLLKGALTGGDDWEDPEKLARVIINDQMSYMLGTVVGFRETTSAFQKAAGVQQFNSGYGGPAGLRFFQELDKLGQQVGQGELDRALFRSTINITGIILHLPSSQINRTVDGIVAIADGKTSNPLAPLVGAPPKK